MGNREVELLASVTKLLSEDSLAPVLSSPQSKGMKGPRPVSGVAHAGLREAISTPGQPFSLEKVE